MKLCGFSFVKNAVRFDYPFVESYRSVLPLVDKLIVAVGKSDDGTLEQVRAISPKIEVIETEWDESAKEGGKVFALETDKAFQAIPAGYDWALYIQADEVLHEKDYPVIQAALEKYRDDKHVEGLLFNYRHFFGSYDYVGAKYSWYRREIRIVKNDKSIFSYRDAQGFRRKPDEKLSVKAIPAEVYHYGWVRDPNALQQKIRSNIQIYMSEAEAEKRPDIQQAAFDYNAANEPVEKFSGTHPALMQERIARKNWPFAPQQQRRYASGKDRLKRTIAKLTGWYIGEYKNYKTV